MKNEVEEFMRRTFDAKFQEYLRAGEMIFCNKTQTFVVRTHKGTKNTFVVLKYVTVFNTTKPIDLGETVPNEGKRVHLNKKQLLEEYKKPIVKSYTDKDLLQANEDGITVDDYVKMGRSNK